MNIFHSKIKEAFLLIVKDNKFESVGLIFVLFEIYE